MIPKTIAYGWFGKNPKPQLALDCIESWRRFCPDYEIIELNESMVDMDEPRWVREAREQKKWAFVADFYRMAFM
jgi:mannosyltransferase OCH1-like enzyme